MTKQTLPINLDRALGEDALARDELERGGFARSVLGALGSVCSSSGFVVSVEGAWGSGKTSALAMIRQLAESQRGGGWVVVGFNPWLVGDRDSLLREFLNAIAAAVRLADHAGNAKKVAKELKNYAKAFDLVKWVPGAEPFASILKAVMESAGSAVEGAAEQKARGLEEQKERLEKELRKYDGRILVLIDDVDRLFPSEVFEMVRIVKAVGELPNVGYVLAWDPRYVSSALERAEVPYASMYLDKVVQVRLPLPVMSESARQMLVQAALRKLPAAATAAYFEGQEERFSLLYSRGLRDLLEHPRDVHRVFNTLSVIEPELREEVVFADILGLACLMVRAPDVYELLRSEPQLFVRDYRNRFAFLPGKRPVEEESARKIERAIAQCSVPVGARKLVYHLFPEAARVGVASPRRGQPSQARGHIATEGRLDVALKLGVGAADASLAQARAFVFDGEKRAGVLKSLREQNAIGFLHVLEEVVETARAIPELPRTCLDIARLPDRRVFAAQNAQTSILAFKVDETAFRVLMQAVRNLPEEEVELIGAEIVADPDAVSVAAAILRTNLPTNVETDIFFQLTPPLMAKAVKSYVENVLAKVRDDSLWDCANPWLALRMLGRFARADARKAYNLMSVRDPKMDRFALTYLWHSTSSSGGAAYGLPSDKTALEAFVDLDKFKAHARRRLQDAALDYPMRAVWRSVVEGRPLYGSDGRPVEMR